MNNDADTLVCEVCGKFDAIQIGDRVLCTDCYQNAGSCCPEFGSFDLWQDDPRVTQQCSDEREKEVSAGK